MKKTIVRRHTDTANHDLPPGLHPVLARALLPFARKPLARTSNRREEFPREYEYRRILLERAAG